MTNSRLRKDATANRAGVEFAPATGCQFGGGKGCVRKHLRNRRRKQ